MRGCPLVAEGRAYFRQLLLADRFELGQTVLEAPRQRPQRPRRFGLLLVRWRRSFPQAPKRSPVRYLKTPVNPTTGVGTP